MTKLDWIAQIRPTVFHAAAGLCAGQIPMQPELSEAIGDSCQQIANRLSASGIPSRPFWSQLIVLSALNDAVSQIVITAISKLRGMAGTPETLTGSMARDVSAIVQQTIPHLIAPAELQTRSEPLRQQWDAFGSGLMRLMAVRTSEDLIVEQCRVLLVQPLFAGGGAAHLDYNAVHLEAMLVNVDDRLPEVVRLAWLVAQLNHDLPRYSERIHRDRLPTLSGLATLPVSLLAAEELGLARFDRQTLLVAIDRWLSPSFHEVSWSDHEQLATVIENWWGVCSSGTHAWAAALAALDQMLS